MKKPKNVKLGHRIHVDWVDSWAEYGWQPIAAKYEQPYTIKTVGILVAVSKTQLSVTANIDTQGTPKAGTILHIPWAAVTKYQQFEQIVRWGNNENR